MNAQNDPEFPAVEAYVKSVIGDQPKPDAGWATNEQGEKVPAMQIQPKPATGEWTVAWDNMVYAGDSRDSNNFLAIIRDDEGRNRIVDAHNAALAAERDENWRSAYDNLLIDYTQLREQLAAERERTKTLEQQLERCLIELDATRKLSRRNGIRAEDNPGFQRHE